MTYNPDIHHRQSIRLKEYDYSSARAYFINICAQNRECLFGEIIDEGMLLNDAGLLVKAAWNELPGRFPHVSLDEFVVMPNHVHGIMYTLLHVVDFYKSRAAKPALRRNSENQSPVNQDLPASHLL